MNECCEHNTACNWSVGRFLLDPLGRPALEPMEHAQHFESFSQALIQLGSLIAEAGYLTTATSVRQFICDEWYLPDSIEFRIGQIMFAAYRIGEFK